MRALTIVCLLLAINVSAVVKPRLDIAEGGEPLAGYGCLDSVAERMSTRPLADLEGIWEFTGDGAIVAIERVADPMRTATSTYRMTLILSPDRSVPPGTVVGTAVDGSQRRLYDARIFTGVKSGRLTSPKGFTMRVDDDGRLKLSHYRQGPEFNLWRMLPWAYRHIVRIRDDRPADIDGMIRVYPPATTSPRYL